MKTKLLALPVDEFIEPANELLEKFSNLVIMAAPGAGKTTRIPPGLVDLVAPTGKQIWVLEPRRMAAVAAAHRIAEEQGWQLGQEVGYQVRFESKASPQTQILFLTEALLARKFLQDPDLSTCGLVILDEFHERSLQVDLALGLLKEAQMLNRPDLKIVVMSATLNPDPLLKFLTSAAHLEIPGRLFDLEIEYGKASQTLRTDHVFIDRVYEALFEHLRATPKGKDILVFLPGFSEISRLQKKIETASCSSSF